MKRRTGDDVVAIGRVGVDLYPLQQGVGLEDVETFAKYLGGSAANVAVAAARHGRPAQLISRVGADPFGLFVMRKLASSGVGTDHVRTAPSLSTPVTFCEILPPDDFPLYFYRKPIAPDLTITGGELDLDMIASAGVFWATATGLSEQPSRAAHHIALDARGRRGHTVLDLDYRSDFWPSREAATAEIRRALPKATIAIGNLDECEIAVGERDAHQAARLLLEAGVELAVVKQGPRGVLARTRDEIVELPPHAVTVVNGLGAGDAFGGAFCHGLLAGWGLERTLRFANAAGAIVATRHACADAMPSSGEVERFLLDPSSLGQAALRPAALEPATFGVGAERTHV